MNITMLSSPIEVITTRKTQAYFWKDVKIGDILVFSQDVQPQGRGRGLYAVDIKIENKTQGKSAYNTMNQATSNMRGFEFKEASE